MENRRIEFPNTHEDIYFEISEYKVVNGPSDYSGHLSFLTDSLAADFAKVFLQCGIKLRHERNHITILPGSENFFGYSKNSGGIYPVSVIYGNKRIEALKIMSENYPYYRSYVNFHDNPYVDPIFLIQTAYDCKKFSSRFYFPINIPIRLQTRIEQTELLIEQYAFFLFILKNHFEKMPKDLYKYILLMGVQKQAPSLIRFSLFTPRIRDYLDKRKENIFQRIDRVQQRIDDKILRYHEFNFQLHTHFDFLNFFTSENDKQDHKDGLAQWIAWLRILKDKIKEGHLKGEHLENIVLSCTKFVEDSLYEFMKERLFEKYKIEGDWGKHLKEVDRFKKEDPKYKIMNELFLDVNEKLKSIIKEEDASHYFCHQP